MSILLNLHLPKKGWGKKVLNFGLEKEVELSFLHIHARKSEVLTSSKASKETQICQRVDLLLDNFKRVDDLNDIDFLAVDWPILRVDMIWFSSICPIDNSRLNWFKRQIWIQNLQPRSPWFQLFSSKDLLPDSQRFPYLRSSFFWKCSMLADRTLFWKNCVQKTKSSQTIVFFLLQRGVEPIILFLERYNSIFHSTLDIDFPESI